MDAFSGIGKAVKEQAQSYQTFRSQADKLVEQIRPTFSAMLDEITKAAGVPLRKKVGTSEYVAGSLKIDAEGLGLMIHFTPEEFLVLRIFSDSRCYKRVSEEVLAKFGAEHGYAMSNGLFTKKLQIQEANTKEELPNQINPAVAFIQEEVRALLSLGEDMA